MIFGCVDVDYRADGSAVAACIVFESWAAAGPTVTHTTRLAEVEPYVPGAFYRRELPCLMAVIERAACSFDVVLVDAYVTLDAAGTPGLGAHLHAALGGRAAVVGVAKTRFVQATEALPLLRGASEKPLWISAVGLPVADAAEGVRAMHGDHRVPTLLKLVDRLARDA